MLRQLAVAGLLAIPGSTLAQQAASPLEAAAFMAGCWRGPVGQDRVIEEYYTTPHGNLMQGMTRYLRGKLVVDWWFNTEEHPHAVDCHSPSSAAFWIFWGLMLLTFATGFLPKRGGHGKHAGGHA